MGFIALALASADPHHLLGRHEAIRRIRQSLESIGERLPHDEGVVPHFIDSITGAVVGHDYFSTVETAWLVTGALWSAAFLEDEHLTVLANGLYDRVHWHYWTAPDAERPNGLLRHGKYRDGRFLGCSWDRLNGETAFMYVLAAGAAKGRAIHPAAWHTLRPFYGSVAGLRFNNADLGLFVFQYGLDLLDLARWRAPGELDLAAEARIAASANREACCLAADEFSTYRRYWGLSAGDGPSADEATEVYRCYAPSGPIDGTAHITATLASITHAQAEVLENCYQAQHDADLAPHGRYGFSNVNVDRHWHSRDVVGIDVGAAALALDNFLMENRIRRIADQLPCVQRGLDRLGFVRASTPVERSTPSELRLAS
jgi:hypothetical protein